MSNGFIEHFEDYDAILDLHVDYLNANGRLLVMIPTLFVISVISFIIIQLPPGDYITRYMDALMEDQAITETEMAQIEALRERYGLNRSMIYQYFKWMGKIFLEGDFGYSFEWQKPVGEIIWERMALTLMVTGSAMFFTWIVAFPIGFYSAVRQYSAGDYFFTLLGFFGLAVPNFMLALIMMYVAFLWTGDSVGGLFSSEYINAAWSLGRFFDMVKHLWIPEDSIPGKRRISGYFRRYSRH